MPRNNKKVKKVKRAFENSQWHVSSFLRSLDNFGQSIPAFNIKGDSSVNTLVGGFLTFAIMTLTLGYATAGMIDLINKEDPIVNENVVKDYYTVSNGKSLDLKQGNQAFAIEIMDYETGSYEIDPSYVRIMAWFHTDTQ